MEIERRCQRCGAYLVYRGDYGDEFQCSCGKWYRVSYYFPHKLVRSKAGKFTWETCELLPTVYTYPIYKETTDDASTQQSVPLSESEG